MADPNQFVIPEKTTPSYHVQLERSELEKHGVVPQWRWRALLLSEISSLVLTYYNKADGATINSRSAQNILNANNVTVDALGFLLWDLQQADTAIIDSTLADYEEERHVAEFTLTTTASKVFLHRVEFLIQQRTKVT